MKNLQKWRKKLLIGIIIVNVLVISSSSLAAGYEQNVSTQGAIIQVAGKVIYQASGTQATVSLYNSEGFLVASTTTAANGAYTLSAEEGAGYKVVISKPAYLSYTITGQTLAAGYDIETVDLRQLAGDIDGNGVVNATDLTYLLSEFNRNPVNYFKADIDGNGVVNATDLTYLLAAFNKHDVVKIAEPLPTTSLSSQLTINALAGKEYDISISARAITSFGGMVITMQYDSAVFDLADLCAFTKAKETTTGLLPAAGITVSQVSPGEIKFTVNKTIASGKQWSGALTTVRLKAKATATSVVSVK